MSAAKLTFSEREVPWVGYVQSIATGGVSPGSGVEARGWYKTMMAFMQMDQAAQRATEEAMGRVRE
jgi:hypothetical protein